MGPYGFSLALGATGLAVMALLGLSHHGGDHAHGGAHHAGHAGPGHAGHGHDGGHGGAHDPSQAGHHHASEHAGRLITLLSPRLLFSFLVGAGATGMLAGRFLVEPFIAAAALAGGFAFERFLIRPIWAFLFRFESRPAALLESAVMEEARAVADFDRDGQGLIQLELDGQVLQLLGTLTAEERAVARRVRRGDLLRIEDVDPARNRCTVTFAGSRPPGEAP
jgi:hypothetical protein